ncbi:MAG: S8 family serine peptidase [Acidobacteria bacterium]|nr:S8 family serine peptidase [Acidobacteriota bacterium]
MVRNISVLISIVVCVACFGPCLAGEDLPANLHWWVVEHTANGQKADFFIVLKDRADLSPARALAAKPDKGRFVFSALTRTAVTAQAPLRTWLDARGATYQPYWIVNAILVHGGDRDLAVAAARRPEVDRVEGNPLIRNVLPLPGPVEEVAAPPAPLAPDSVEWNISKVNAPAVWNLGYHGEGVVVGGQDTGYRWTHNALKSKYRGWDGASADHNYNWHDSIHSGGGSCGANSQVPCDDYGHGTHTMGTVLGDDGGTNQVGMAPGAKWIGCRNMNGGAGTPATYLECFQFFLAPTRLDGSNPDPAKAPDVTVNSWGCPTSEGCAWDTLQQAMDNQKAAGIMTVVSAGNSGSSCNSVTDPPAIYDSAFTVGSTTSSDSMSYFSSRGYATGTNLMKPNIVAPGSGIRSSYYSSDSSYTSMDGTSMAGPHVTGAVALLWSAHSCFMNQQDDTETALGNAARDLPAIVESCGGNYVTGPNNTWGHGRLDILAAVNAGCLCTVPGVPAIDPASVPGDNQITISWTPGTPTGDAYNIYRSIGECPAGPFELVRGGHPASPWTDTNVSGGITYAYKVAALDPTGGCESAASACVSASATGACIMAPEFAGLASVSNPGQSTCALTLAWPAATANCGGPVRYSVYRSTTSPVAIVPANLIASGIQGTSYVDAAGLVSGTSYFYVVRAFDASNGIEDANVVELAGAPTGPLSTQTLTETFEAAGGFDLAGWSTAVLSGPTNWAWSDEYSQSPTHSWYAEDTGRVGDKVLVSPTFVAQANSGVSFYQGSKFEGTIASCKDAGTLEYGIGPAYAEWRVVPDGWFTARGFNGTVSTCCSNPLAGKRAWCSTNTSPQPVALGLGALAGETVRLRWHEGEDNSTAAVGWYVDTVVLGNVMVGDTCATGNAPPPPVAPSARFVRGAGELLNVTYDAQTCSAQKLVVLYNALGTWDGYAGCAQPDGGNAGSTTIDSTGQANVWYNLVWTDGATAGHPGFGSADPRTWTAGSLCGVTDDDHTRTTCP